MNAYYILRTPAVVENLSPFPCADFVPIARWTSKHLGLHISGVHVALLHFFLENSLEFSFAFHTSSKVVVHPEKYIFKHKDATYFSRNLEINAKTIKNPFYFLPECRKWLYFSDIKRN